MSAAAAIQISGLVQRFGETTALNRVDLSVPSGALFGLLGPDGAGKTTLLRAISTLGQQDSGEITVLDRAAAQLKRADTLLLGYMPQHFSMYPDLSVAENLRMFATLRGVPKPEQAERQAQLLEMVGMTGFEQRLAGRLSGGMKQKLMLASVLMHNPQLLILDEPTTGVDPLSRYEFWELLDRLHAEGKTVLVATPYMEEAAHCTEIAFLAAGRITMTGSPEQIIAAVEGESFEIHTPELFEVQQHLNQLRQVVTTALMEDSIRVLVTGLSAVELGDALSAYLITEILPVETDLETAFIYLAEQATAGPSSPSPQKVEG